MLADSIVLEQGKTFAGRRTKSVHNFSKTHNFPDAHGDILRGLQVVENAIGVTFTLMGDKIEGELDSTFRFIIAPHYFNYPTLVAKDMDTEVRKLPLGVCASIAPFNFPA
jgi:malonate-semialdehyde dehydrogenase (acetylating)/methylmalonate-semialdehyde dehydrogenase